LPNEPLNIFPFFVFLSPLPIIITLNKMIVEYEDTKAPESGARWAKDPKISYTRSRSFVYHVVHDNKCTQH
jgi:hypothetical protein